MLYYRSTSTCLRLSFHDARKTIAGPSRSTIGVVPKSNTLNASSAIRGQSKSSTAIYKLCRERLERSLPRAASTNSIRFRRQPSNKTLCQSVSRSIVNERVESGTTSTTRERDRSLSRVPVRGKESDRNVFRPLPRAKDSDRNVNSLPQPKHGESDRNIAGVLRGKESDRSVAKSASKIRESDRNVARSASTIRESDRNLARSASKTRQSERNLTRSASRIIQNERNVARSASKIRESDRNVTRSSSKTRESDRNVARSASTIRESDRNLARSASKTRESARNVTRSTSKTRESDRSVTRSASKTKESDRNVARSSSKIRYSERNPPRLPLKCKGSDIIIARPAANAKGKEQALSRPLTPHSEAYGEISRSPSKCEKSRNVSAHSLSKQKVSKQSIASPKRPASSASGTRGQSSSTYIPDRTKEKSSALSLKSGGILSSRKLLSHLSLKKLSSFAFRKKAAAKNVVSSQKECANKPKDKDRPKSADSALSTSRFDDPTQSSAHFTWSEETITKLAQEYPVAHGSQQPSALEQAPTTICPHQGATVAPLSQDTTVQRHDEELISEPKISAHRHLEPAYQKQDIFSLGSFTECSEELAPTEECYCVPESTLGEREPVCSGETSSIEPKGDDLPPPKCLKAEPIEPKSDAVCSPEISIGKGRQDEGKPPSISSQESLPEFNRPLHDIGSAVPLTKLQDSEVEHTASQKRLDCISKEVAPAETLHKDSSEHVSKLPTKKTESILKRTSSQIEHPCVSSVSFQKKEATSKKGPVLHEHTCVDSKPSDVGHKTKQDVSSIPAFISECLSSELPKREPRHEEVPKSCKSEVGVQAADQPGQKYDSCVPSTSEPEPIPETEPAVCAMGAGPTESLPTELTTSSDSSSAVAQYQLLAVPNGNQDPSSDATEGTLDALCSEMSQESLRVINRGVSKPPPTELMCYPEESSRTGDEGKLSPSISVHESEEGSRSKPTISDVELTHEEPSSSLEKPTVTDDAELKTEEPSSCQEQQTFSDDKLKPEEPSSCQEQPTVSDGELKPEEPSSCQEQSTVSDGELKPEKLSPTQEQASVCTKRDTATSDDAVWDLLDRMPRVEDCKCQQSSDCRNPRRDESGKEECPESKPTVHKPKSISKLPKLPDKKEKLATDQGTPSKEGTSESKGPERKSCKDKDSSNPNKAPDLGLVSDEQPAETVKCVSRTDKEQKSDGEERCRTSPKESKSLLGKAPSGTNKLPCDSADVFHPQRHSTAESMESLPLAEQTETNSVEEGTAARCEPISKLKLKKHCKEPTQSDIRDIQEDIRIWKDLYAGCLERLRSLQQMRPSGRPERALDNGPSFDKQLRRTSNNCQTSIDEIKGGMDEAVRVLESEYGQVESALRKHSAVLAELVSVLQNRITAQPEAMRAAELAELGLGAMKDVKDSIHYLKALITENETLTMQLAAERAKQQVLRQVQVTNDVVDESITATEDKLHRTNSLLKMQMKRLQYEISRLTEAQNLESKAVGILVDQAEADVENDRENLASLQESNERLHELLSSKRFVSGQRVFKRASRGSFLSDDPIGNSYCAARREQLECRVVISDRVQRNLELSNDEIMYLENLGRRMCQQITETNEEIRKNEFAWLQLRKERDELTKNLFPDLDRLQMMQDVVKEKLDLESKLRKENMLFRHQLEEFQKDLLEVETELMSGAVTRRTEATKNKVLELETLYENAKLHNAKLREDCEVKHLTISRHDSLASLSIDEEEFQRQISEKIQRMELRIQADIDRRFLRPKRYVLEAPGKAKVSFRGQRNVIRAPKNVAEWRRKREVPSGTAEPPKPPQPKDAQELRREILTKLAEEKEKAKEQLLRYEAHQIRQTADGTAEPNARELNELLGRLGRFLNQSRGQEPSLSRPATGAAAAQSLHGGEFGETLMHLIVQLDQLESALTGPGDDNRRRTVRTTVASERHRELLDKLPDASKRGSENSNPTRGSTTTNNNSTNNNSNQNKPGGGSNNTSSNNNTSP